MEILIEQYNIISSSILEVKIPKYYDDIFNDEYQLIDENEHEHIYDCFNYFEYIDMFNKKTIKEQIDYIFKNIKINENYQNILRNNKFDDFNFINEIKTPINVKKRKFESIQVERKRTKSSYSFNQENITMFTHYDQFILQKTHKKENKPIIKNKKKETYSNESKPITKEEQRQSHNKSERDRRSKLNESWKKLLFAIKKIDNNIEDSLPMAKILEQAKIVIDKLKKNIQKNIEKKGKLFTEREKLQRILKN